MDPRTCSRCGVTYPPQLVEMAFRSRGRAYPSRCICRPCEQTGRDERKRKNRWVAKARDTIRHHARSLGVPREELIERFGWDVDEIAKQAEHAYGGGCGYCTAPYGEMGHGFQDISLDVMYHDQPPYFRTNTKWCCQTCNRRKGVQTPEAFIRTQQVFVHWGRQLEAMLDDPQGFGRLF